MPGVAASHGNLRYLQRNARSVRSIAITGTTSIQAGSTTTLTATATYTDNTTADVTSTATWTTADATMATVAAGVVTGVKLTANVVISATLGAISGTATCSVYVSFAGVTAGAWTQVWGLALTRASSATAKDGDSAIITSGIGVNVARVGRNRTADVMGLLLEISRINRVSTNRDATSASWIAGTAAAPTRPDGTGPDGSTTDPTKWVILAAQYSRYFQFSATTGEKLTFSMWHQSVSGSITAQWQTGAPSPTYSSTTSWGRITAVFTTVGVQYYLTPAITAAQTIRTDLYQVELGEFETSVILNTGSGTATRAGERLALTSNITTANRVNLGWKLIMLGSSAQFTDNSTAVLAYTDANNSVIWNTSTRVLTITANGSTNTCTLTAWSKFDTVEIYVGAGGASATVVKTRINGGSANTLAITGSALTSYVASSIDWLCNSTTLQTSCWINELYLEVPAWAA